MGNPNQLAINWWNSKSFEAKWYLIVKYKKLIPDYPDTNPNVLTSEIIRQIGNLEWKKLVSTNSH